MTPWILTGLGALLLAACAPQTAPPDTAVTPRTTEEARVSGTVRVVGSAPVNVQVVLEPEQGGAIRLTGPLRDELASLAGAEVAVVGMVSPSPDPLAARQVEATSYEVVSIDGRPVVVGEIVAAMGEQATLRTAAGEEIVLRTVPGIFRVGQKVWVQGPGTINVQSYGVLRP